jgi:hypothetical protein
MTAAGLRVNGRRRLAGQIPFVATGKSVSDPNHVACPLRAGSGAPLRGQVTAPGDKSISHRAVILGLLALGETRIQNLLEGPASAA